MDVQEFKLIAYAAALKTELVSLKARAAACGGYAYNHAMQIEACILWRQVDAITSELEQANASLPVRQR